MHFFRAYLAEKSSKNGLKTLICQSGKLGKTLSTCYSKVYTTKVRTCGEFVHEFVMQDREALNLLVWVAADAVSLFVPFLLQVNFSEKGT